MRQEGGERSSSPSHPFFTFADLFKRTLTSNDLPLQGRRAGCASGDEGVRQLRKERVSYQIEEIHD